VNLQLSKGDRQNRVKAEVYREPNKELVEALKSGDHSAFKQVYSLYRDRIYSLSLHMIHSPDDAGELTQQIFVKLYTMSHSFDYRSSFSTWLYRLSMNTCYDYLRKRKQRRTISYNDLSDETLSHEQPEGIDVSRAVHNALQSLKPKLRTVMVLKYLEDFSYAEIAEIVGCSIGTVGSRLNRGHKYLAKELGYLKNVK
jgi:RNA polymerase sigma-70 factor (ECF subfamily)